MLVIKISPAKNLKTISIEKVAAIDHKNGKNYEDR